MRRSQAAELAEYDREVRQRDEAKRLCPNLTSLLDVSLGILETTIEPEWKRENLERLVVYVGAALRDGTGDITLGQARQLLIDLDLIDDAEVVVVLK